MTCIHTHARTRVYGARASLRGYGAQYKLVSDKLRFYLGTLTLPEVKEKERARDSERGRGQRCGWREQEKLATARLELSSVWQCSTATTLAGLSAHYVDRRSHHHPVHQRASFLNYSPQRSMRRPFFREFRSLQ